MVTRFGTVFLFTENGWPFTKVLKLCQIFKMDCVPHCCMVGEFDESIPDAKNSQKPWRIRSVSLSKQTEIPSKQKAKELLQKLDEYP